MLKITRDFRQRPVIHCHECDRPIVTHRGAVMGFDRVGKGCQSVIIVHKGCKSGDWEWSDVDKFFWLLADELGVLNQAVRAVKRKRKKTRRRIRKPRR